MRPIKDVFLNMVVHDALPRDERLALVTAARAMRDSEWWREIPVYVEPAPVSGEIDAR